MQLISKYNKGIRYLLCAIDLLVNMLPLLFLKKTKKVITIGNAFQ